MFDCPNCAGIMLRLGEENGEDVLRAAQLISCPGCGERLPIDDDTPPGTLIRHDGAEFVLTKEFGAFVLESS
ncbi:MAG TPA: hypothetical protein QF533_06415 [Nitrospinota bacterium]|nr:hypothetical protein [Nitrospinota bacterium]